MLFPEPFAKEEPVSNVKGGSKAGVEEARALTVTQLVGQINAFFKQVLPKILVEGEVSNFRRPGPAGHLYFSIKDAGGSIPVAIWASTGRSMRFQLEDGLSVRISGKIEYYGPHGKLQLIAERIAPVGEGELELAFRQLQEKLQAEGLFDISRKKPIPPFPERIGIVTGANTAAQKDMLETLRLRWPLAEVRLFPVLVQGDSAAREIANTLRWINSFAELPNHRLDVVLLGRGGGSREDLWAFNREEVARAISACVVPIVTGIGHEHDVTIADLVADMRGVTPTDAAGLVSPQLNAIQQGVLGLGESLVRGMERRVERLRGRLDRARPLVLGKLLVSRVAKARQTTTESSRRLQTALLNHLKARRNQLAVLSGKLDAISPLRVLARGYSLTQTICDGTGNKKLLTEASKVLVGDTLVTRLAKGSVVSAVLEVHPGLEPLSNSKDGAR